jgi:S-adenosylmethionine hydrolase
VRTYSDAEPGTPVVLSSSTDLLEVAVVQGSAARHFEAGVGRPVVIAWNVTSSFEA